MKNKFVVAMALYAVLAALAWGFLTDPKLRVVTWALLAMFAFKTWIHHRKALLDEQDEMAQFSKLKADS